MGKERENSYQKLKRSLEERHTKNTWKLIQNILIATYVCLSQSEESKCMLTHGTDGIT